MSNIETRTNNVNLNNNNINSLNKEGKMRKETLKKHHVDFVKLLMAADLTNEEAKNLIEDLTLNREFVDEFFTIRIYDKHAPNSAPVDYKITNDCFYLDVNENEVLDEEDPSYISYKFDGLKKVKIRAAFDENDIINYVMCKLRTNTSHTFFDTDVYKLYEDVEEEVYNYVSDCRLNELMSLEDVLELITDDDVEKIADYIAMDEEDIEAGIERFLTEKYNEEKEEEGEDYEISFDEFKDDYLAENDIKEIRKRVVLEEFNHYYTIGGLHNILVDGECSKEFTEAVYDELRWAEEEILTNYNHRGSVEVNLEGDVKVLTPIKTKVMEEIIKGLISSIFTSDEISRNEFYTDFIVEIELKKPEEEILTLMFSALEQDADGKRTLKDIIQYFIGEINQTLMKPFLEDSPFDSVISLNYF